MKPFRFVDALEDVDVGYADAVVVLALWDVSADVDRVAADVERALSAFEARAARVRTIPEFVAEPDVLGAAS